ncbi:MAG: PstS family phosphate ABC transporter substrate-binding protein [Verrucomicrobiota bacterium]
MNQGQSIGGIHSKLLIGFWIQLIVFVLPLFSLKLHAQAESEASGWGSYVSGDEVLLGRISAMGSDTLSNVMAVWSFQFSELHPGVTVEVEGKGSSTAPPGLIEGTADIGVMSRRMTAAELLQFSEKYGRKPLAIPVALDAVVLYVNAANPIKGMGLAEVDGVFSETRLLGGESKNTWGDLGLTGLWALRPISVYGRNSASGTYAFFKGRTLAAGNFRKSVQQIPGSSALVQAVGRDPYAIGYSGIGYKTSGVRAIPIYGENRVLFEPNFENCMNGQYPLARPIYIYVVDSELGAISPKIEAFVRYILSEQAQEFLAIEGFYPMPRSLAISMVSRLEQG